MGKKNVQKTHTHNRLYLVYGFFNIRVSCNLRTPKAWLNTRDSVLLCDIYVFFFIPFDKSEKWPLAAVITGLMWSLINHCEKLLALSICQMIIIGKMMMSFSLFLFRNYSYTMINVVLIPSIEQRKHGPPQTPCDTI